MLDALELMQASWESEIRFSRRLKLDRSTLVPDLVPISKSNLSSPVAHLEIAANKVYLATGNLLIQQRYTDSSLSGEAIAKTKMQLDNTIESLRPNLSGCLVTTSSSVSCLSEETNLAELHSLLNFPTNMVTAIYSPGNWLAVSWVTEDLAADLAIYSIADASFQYSLASDRSWQSLIALDRRHIIGIHQNSEQQTEFHLLNRRGHWLAKFTVKIQLDKVIYNPQYPNRLLATEVDNPQEVILIALEKFNLRRIPLKIEAEFIEPCQQGYLIGDRYGKIFLINYLGECLGRFQAPIASDCEVTAIALGKSRLFLVSTSDSVSQLHSFSWENGL